MKEEPAAKEPVAASRSAAEAGEANLQQHQQQPQGAPPERAPAGSDTGAAAAEAAAGPSGRPAPPRGVRLSDAACPGARAFSGCLLRTFTCRACGHAASVAEHTSHLSLQLPPGRPVLPPRLEELLVAHFKVRSCARWRWTQC